MNLVLAAGLIAGLAACTEKAPEYEPASPAGTLEVYFPNGLPTSYDLKAAGGSITVPVMRVDDSQSSSVSVAVTADKIFTVPSQVTFNAGTNSAELVITYNVDDLVADQTYPFALEITSETSEYGVAEYTFNGTVPAAWTLFATGTLTESPGWWGETEPNKKLYYQEITPDLWYCRIPDCFGYETIKGGGTYPVQDYLFYWEKSTNILYVCSHPMGYQSGGRDIYYGTDADYYMGHYYNVGQITTSPYDWGTDAWFKYYKQFLAQAYGNDPNLWPHYDGNGGFYLADCYMYNQIANGGEKEGYGAIWDDERDVFICDGFVRTTDYNTAYDYEDLFDVDVVAESLDGAEFSSTLCMTEKDTTIYYVRDYFGTDSGLAFIVPADQWDDELGHVADNAEIINGDNEQYTGIDVWGKELVYKIGKKSYVEWPEDAEYPIFHVNVDLSLYSYEEKDGERVNYVEDYKLGTFADVISVSGEHFSWFTAYDLYGINKADYVGDFVVNATSFKDGLNYYWTASIEDAGEDEDGTSWLAFKSFAPWNATVLADNTLYVQWYKGFVYLPESLMEGQFNYSGQMVDMYIIPYDSADGTFYEDSELIMGYYFDDASEFLAFVNAPYNDDPVDGVTYYLNGLGWLGKYHHMYFEWADSSSSVTKKYPVYAENYRVRKLSLGATGKNKDVPANVKAQSVAKPAAPKASVSSASSRIINTSNAVEVNRSKKNFVEASARSLR